MREVMMNVPAAQPKPEKRGEMAAIRHHHPAAHGLEHQKLVEKHVGAAGLGEVKANHLIVGAPALRFALPLSRLHCSLGF